MVNSLRAIWLAPVAFPRDLLVVAVLSHFGPLIQLTEVVAR